MKVFGLRIHIVAITFVLVLGGALAAGQWTYEKRVRAPLEQRLLALPGVEAVSVEPTTGLRALGASNVRVKLAREADLERGYRAVEQVAAEFLGSRLGRIYIDDARTPELQEVLREMRFAVEEGVATGFFRRMKDHLGEVAVAHGLDAFRVSMDNRFVYLTLARDEAYLHHVVARDDAGAPLAPAGMGAATVQQGVYSGG